MRIFKKKKITAQLSGFMGNFLESYDLMIFFYLAYFVSKTFLPPGNEIKNLLNVFIILLVGVLARPVGGVILGFIADYIGRKRILVYSLAGMGICTALISIIPGYTTIGYAAPFFLILLRAMQSVFAGGEYITSLAFLVEQAPNNQKGRYGSWVSTGINFGSLTASILGTGVVFLIGNHLVPEWSWRILFVLALIGTVVGTWVRINCTESISFILENSSESTHPVKKLKDLVWNRLKSYKERSLIIILLTWIGTATTYQCFVYSVVHIQQFGHLSQFDAFAINTISLVVLVFLIPYFGILHDKFGAKRCLLFSVISFALISFPFFSALSSGNFYETLFMKVLISFPAACLYAIAPVVIIELFPVKVRCTLASLLYGASASIFGVSSPAISLYFVSLTGNLNAPAYYMFLSCIVGFVGVLLLKNEFFEDSMTMSKQELIDPTQ